MFQGRGRLFVGLAVVVLVLALAAGLFSVQYAQAYAQCSAIPSSSACADVSGARIAVDGLFVAIAGVLAAVVMAITTGINWSTSPAPNTALALRLAEEDEAFRQEQAHRAELRDLNSLALAHANELAKVRAEAAAAGITLGPDGMPVDDNMADGILVEEEEHVETVDEARRRVIADRLRNLARQHPDSVAEVLKTWINQPRRG